MDAKPYSQSMIARFLTCRMAMKMHLNSNGAMRLTRTATPTNLRNIASEFTGKEYAASKKGMQQAYTDLCNMEIVPITEGAK